MLQYSQSTGTWEEGTDSEEEDIIGDFPPRLPYLKHTHLVYFRFPKKAVLVCPETTQEARSDMGKSVMVD